MSIQPQIVVDVQSIFASGEDENTKPLPSLDPPFPTDDPRFVVLGLEKEMISGKRPPTSILNHPTASSELKPIAVEHVVTPSVTSTHPMAVDEVQPLVSTTSTTSHSIKVAPINPSKTGRTGGRLTSNPKEQLALRLKNTPLTRLFALDAGNSKPQQTAPAQSSNALALAGDKQVDSLSTQASLSPRIDANSASESRNTANSHTTQTYTPATPTKLICSGRSGKFVRRQVASTSHNKILSKLWGFTDAHDCDPHPMSYAFAIQKHQTSQPELSKQDLSENMKTADTDSVATSGHRNKPMRKEVAPDPGVLRMRTRKRQRNVDQLSLAVKGRISRYRHVSCALDFLSRARLGFLGPRPSAHITHVLQNMIRSDLTNTNTSLTPIFHNDQLREVFISPSFVCINRGEQLLAIGNTESFGTGSKVSLLDRGRSGSRMVDILEYSPKHEPVSEHRLIVVTEEGSLRSYKLLGRRMVKSRKIQQSARPIKMHWLDDQLFVLKSKLTNSNAPMLSVFDATTLCMLYQVRIAPKFFGADIRDVDLQHGCLWVQLADSLMRCFLFDDFLEKNCHSSKRSKDELLKVSEVGDTHTVTSRPRPYFEVECCDPWTVTGQLEALPYFALQWNTDRDGTRNKINVLSVESGASIGSIAIDQTDEDEDDTDTTSVMFVRLSDSAVVAPCRIICKRAFSVSVYSIQPEHFIGSRSNRFKESEDPDDNDDSADSDVQPLLQPICCTYTQGYITQNIHICSTCIEKTKQVSGICAFCKVHCHDGHDTIDIGTRHDFRCDCGVSSKGLERCLLMDEPKPRINKKNKYNHNFQLRYCVCDGQDLGGIMVQCTSCDDWLHGECAGINGDEDVIVMEGGGVDFLCNQCLAKEKIPDTEVRLKVKLGRFVNARGRARSNKHTAHQSQSTTRRRNTNNSNSNNAKDTMDVDDDDSDNDNPTPHGSQSKSQKDAADHSDCGTDASGGTHDATQSWILEEDFRIDVTDPSQPNLFIGTSSTQSNRSSRVRRVKDLDSGSVEQSELVHCVCYDHTSRVVGCMIGTFAFFYDIVTGSCLRKIKLLFCDPEWTHEIHLRGSLLVHLASLPSRSKARCDIFDLQSGLIASRV
eukprot:c10088_g1_i1.p1 GENE.c10088_g1_i1~~c10088_g1_i1.p1  ORF type:complete len:1131 (-),score=326.23 c10088_g1_i1:53-3361(-)